MKISIWTPIIAICGLLAYGSLLAVLGINSWTSILIIAAVSGLGGFSLDEVLRSLIAKKVEG